MADNNTPPIQTVTLADIYFKQGFLEKARAVYEGILLDHPDNKKAVERISEINRQLENSDTDVVQLDTSATSESLVCVFIRWLAAIATRRGRV